MGWCRFASKLFAIVQQATATKYQDHRITWQPAGSCFYSQFSQQKQNNGNIESSTRLKRRLTLLYLSFLALAAAGCAGGGPWCELQTLG